VLTIGKRIAIHLDRLGITQVELARRLGLQSSSAVTNWIKGTNNPASERLPEIAAALGMDLSAFFGPVEEGEAA
jgi:transcriptional regulator with XRE-family HTH domain